MNNLIKTILLISACLCTSACNDLDLVNPNAPTEESFWKTEADLYQGLIATYDQLQCTFDCGMYGLEMRIMPQLLSDEGTNQTPDPFADVARFVHDDLNAWETMWRGGYILIGRAYQVIDRAPTIEGSEVPRIVGEAKFLVALGYYNLLTGFGDRIAYVDRIQKPSDKPLPGNPGELWTLTETMLQDAITVLPSTIPEAEYGRATKGAAQALLAKVHLQQGDYSAAEPLLAAVINGGVYSLLNDYTDNFRETNSVNPESIFQVNFLHNGVTGESDNSAHFKLNATSETQGHYGDVQADNFVLASLLTEKDKEGNQDLRTDATIFWEGSSLVLNGLTYAEWIEASPPFNPAVSTSYYKYSESEFIGNREATLRDGGIDYIVIRYADILLLYAETLNQLGKTQEAYPYVDQVRTRSNMRPLSEIASDLSQADFHQQIKHERLTELAGEGVRWWDLKRWGDYGPTIANDFTIPALRTTLPRDPNFSSFTLGQDELWAIPQSELDLNENLVQNPGY